MSANLNACQAGAGSVGGAAQGPGPACLAFESQGGLTPEQAGECSLVCTSASLMDSANRSRYSAVRSNCQRAQGDAQPVDGETGTVSAANKGGPSAAAVGPESQVQGEAVAGTGEPQGDPAAAGADGQTPKDGEQKTAGTDPNAPPAANPANQNQMSAAQMSALRGLSQTPFVPPSMSSMSGMGMDFSSGNPQPDGGYEQAGERVSGGMADGFAPSYIPVRRLDQPLPAGFLNKANPGDGGGRGGGRGPGGGGPGGGPGGSAQAGAAPRGGGANGAAGGARTSVAGGQLGKVGQNSFYQGGGASLAAGVGKGSRTAAATTPPRAPYKPKTNDSSEVLQRLYGQGGNGRGPGYGGGSPMIRTRWGQDCVGTVFCSMEGFFNRIERYPNSEINPDSL